MVGCRLRIQLAEALGPVNQWYCSQHHGYPVTNPELLLIYFIRSGGAADFARRYNEAMSPHNRWFCSEFHRCEIHDPQILWDYYTRARRAETCIEKCESVKELSMAS
jgi:hypothetical protein